MGFWKILFNFIVSILLLCSPVFAANGTKTDNYLIGMTVSKVKDGFYTVSLQFKNDTKEQYEAKDLGNNTYAIMLPQIKSIMGDENITFSDQNPDIEVSVSENKNFTNQKKFHTKIKLKTPEESTLQVLSYGQSDAPVAFDESDLKNGDTQSVTFAQISDWLLYATITLVIMLVVLMIFRKKSDDEDEDYEEKEETQTKSEIESASDYIPITERNATVFEAISQDNTTKESLKDFQNRKEKEEQEILHDEVEETDQIIDKLVQIIIPKNDLVLMPGVPELPGIETKNKRNENTKTVLNNVKVDLYDAEDFSDNVETPQTESMSLSERLKIKDNSQDSEVESERQEILDNISSLSDVPKEVSEENEETQTEENELPDEYEKLLDAFKKTLKIAHKIKDGEEVDPEVTDAFAVDENTGFSLVKLGEKISLVGNIGEKLFIIKTFTPEELNNDTLFMEFCTQTPTYCAYSVILNRFKALVKVTPTEISLIGDYGE